MTDRKESELGYRVVGACFALGACLMLVAWLETEQPLLVVSALLQFVAWFLFVSYANTIAAGRDGAG